MSYPIPAPIESTIAETKHKIEIIQRNESSDGLSKMAQMPRNESNDSIASLGSSPSAPSYLANYFPRYFSAEGAAGSASAQGMSQGLTRNTSSSPNLSALALQQPSGAIQGQTVYWRI